MTTDTRDTKAALELIGRIGYGFKCRLENPGLEDKERLLILASTITLLAVAARLMESDYPLSHGERLLMTRLLLLGFGKLYCQLDGPIPELSSVELLIGDCES